MNFNARITLAIRNFFKKYGKFIAIAIIIWIIVIIINNYIKDLPKTVSLQNTYTPDTAVISSDEVPSQYEETIKSTIKQYFDYCNAKQYQSAYDMLTDNCKSYLYGNELQYFKQYIDSIFTTSKIYNIQNFSNVKTTYIYDINIIDDIGATGTSGDYQPYKEKLSLTKDGDIFKISNNGYIENDQLNLSNEDNYLKMRVTSKDVSYKKEAYNVEIKNKTDSYLVISDNTVGAEITLNLGDGEKRTASNLTNAEVVLKPGETANFVFIFNKYYDDGNTPTEINLNTIRLLNSYSGESEDTTSEATKVVSFNMALK